jgi:hypothetical protein
MSFGEVLNLLEINDDCIICGSKICCLVKSYYCPICGTILGNPLDFGISPCKQMNFKRVHRKPYS